MNHRIRETHGGSLLAAIVLLFADCAPAETPPVQPLPEAPQQAPTLIVHGNGEVNAPPDSATVQLGVEGQADSASAAQQAVGALMQKIIAQVKKQGIPEDRIQTTGLNLSPVYAPQTPANETEPPLIVGYRAANTIQLEVRDLKKLGPAIDAATRAGANRLQSLSFQLQEDLKYRTRALQLAAENAKAKAQALADALGLKLTGIWRVSQSAANIPRPIYGYSTLEKAALAGTPVKPGQIELTANVTVEYQIEPSGSRGKSEGTH